VIGLAIACDNLGGLYERGTEVPHDMDRALRLYAEACGRGDLTGCNNVGHMYELGRGVPQDFVRASHWYEKACDGGVPLGCSNLTQLNGKR
jgi:TPR repeat protein